MKKAKRSQTIHVATSVPDLEKDYYSRMKKYSIIMSLRFVCIALALLIPLPWSIIPILFAVFSPWFAVLIANNKKVETPIVESPANQIEK